MRQRRKISLDNLPFRCKAKKKLRFGRLSDSQAGRKDQQNQRTRSNLDYLGRTFMARIDSPVKCFRFHFARFVSHSQSPSLSLSLFLFPSLFAKISFTRAVARFKELFRVATINFGSRMLRVLIRKRNFVILLVERECRIVVGEVEIAEDLTDNNTITWCCFYR